MDTIKAARKFGSQTKEHAKSYPWLVLYSLATAFVFCGIGLWYITKFAESWAIRSDREPWEIITAGSILLIIITILSLMPVIVFLAYHLFRRKLVLMQAEWELQHYQMEYGTLMNEIKDRFNAAQEVGNYRVPILLATLAMTVGWYLFFFGNGPDVVWKLASGNISILFSRLAEADPVVFGFLGAFCYSLQMMMRRFFAGDIKPSVFMHIGIRTWIVIVLTMAIGAIWTWSGRATGIGAPGALLALSFITGVIPSVGFDVIKKAATPFGIKVGMPFSSGSLDKIPGINIWRQSRLSEEDIDSIPSLAKCDVVALIANTRLGVRRVLHWVDQAILVVHIGESNFGKFLEAGICSATALEAAYAGQLQKNERTTLEEDWKKGQLTTYMGRGGITNVPETPVGLAKSLGQDNEWEHRLRSLMIAICDDVNYQRLWGILHGTTG